jgi:hypothetical protein
MQEIFIVFCLFVMDGIQKSANPNYFCALLCDLGVDFYRFPAYKGYFTHETGQFLEFLKNQWIDCTVHHAQVFCFCLGWSNESGTGFPRQVCQTQNCIYR